MSEIVGVKLQINGGEEVNKTVGSIKKELREAQQAVTELSAKFGATSKEAIEAAKRAAELKDAIGDAKALTDAFNPDAKFKAFSASVAGVASGFAALQGAMGLFGSESEEVQKTLLKVQSAMAISQGLQAVGESIDSFKQLGAVISQSTVFLKANEITTKLAAATQRLFGLSVDATSTSFKVLKGAIAATGIGLLVVALGEAISFMQNYTSATEDAAKAQEELNKKISNSAKVALDAELKSLEQNQKRLIAEAKARGASEAEIFKIEQDGRALRSAALSRYYVEIKERDKAAAKDALNDIENNNIDILVSQENFNEAKRKKQEEQDKKDAEKRKAALEKRLAEEKKTQELIDEARKRNIAARPESITATQDQVLEDEQAARDAEVKAEEEKQAKILAAQMKTVDGKRNILLIDQATQQHISELNIETARKEAEAKEVLLQTTASALTNLSMVAGRETVAGKALAIASSIINTYQGATKALAQGGIAGPIAAAGIIASGLAAVKQIVSVKVPGASGGGGVAANAPSLNTQSPLNPTTIASNQVTLDQRSINAIGNRAIRAYVVESDITSQQQKVRRIQRQTTFG